MVRTQKNENEIKPCFVVVDAESTKVDILGEEKVQHLMADDVNDGRLQVRSTYVEETTSKYRSSNERENKRSKVDPGFLVALTICVLAFAAVLC